MTAPDEIRAALEHIARDQLGWTRPLPDGSLAEALDSVDRLSFDVNLLSEFCIHSRNGDLEIHYSYSLRDGILVLKYLGASGLIPRDFFGLAGERFNYQTCYEIG